MKAEISDLKKKLKEHEERENDLQEEVRNLKDLYIAISENVGKMHDAQSVHEKKVMEEMEAMKEVKESTENEQREAAWNEKAEQQLRSLQDEMERLKETVNENGKQKEREKEDEHKDKDKEQENEDEDGKERMLKMKEWVFSKLELSKSDLNSIYNKLINDGFDDISLLSELNDDTLKSMGIHKRGDRIKILRACKAINADSDK